MRTGLVARRVFLFFSSAPVPRVCAKAAPATASNDWLREAQAAAFLTQCALLLSDANFLSQSDARVLGAFACAAVCWAVCMAAQWAAVDVAAAKWGLATTRAAVPGSGCGHTVLVFCLTAFYSVVDVMARPKRRDKAMGAVYMSLVEAALYFVVATTSVPCFLQPWGARLVPARYVTWCFTNPLVRLASRHVSVCFERSHISRTAHQPSAVTYPHVRPFAPAR